MIAEVFLYDSGRKEVHAKESLFLINYLLIRDFLVSVVSSSVPPLLFVFGGL